MTQRPSLVIAIIRVSGRNELQDYSKHPKDQVCEGKGIDLEDDTKSSIKIDLFRSSSCGSYLYMVPLTTPSRQNKLIETTISKQKGFNG
jgi:hypothetical protein